MCIHGSCPSSVGMPHCHSFDKSDVVIGRESAVIREKTFGLLWKNVSQILHVGNLSSRLGSNVRDVRYKVEVLTNDDPICGLFKNSFVFDLHLPPFRPF